MVNIEFFMFYDHVILVQNPQKEVYLLISQPGISALEPHLLEPCFLYAAKWGYIMNRYF